MTHENSLKSALQSKMTQYESDLKQVSEVIKIHDFIGAAEDARSCIIKSRTLFTKARLPTNS